MDMIIIIMDLDNNDSVQLLDYLASSELDKLSGTTSQPGEVPILVLGLEGQQNDDSQEWAAVEKIEKFCEEKNWGYDCISDLKYLDSIFSNFANECYTRGVPLKNSDGDQQKYMPEMPQMTEELDFRVDMHRETSIQMAQGMESERLPPVRRVTRGSIFEDSDVEDILGKFTEVNRSLMKSITLEDLKLGFDAR